MDLHFNLWLDLPGNSPGVLDVGVLLKESRQIETLNIYIPGLVALSKVRDLSPILQDETTLSAVFNSTLFLGDVRQRSFDVKNANGEIGFCVVRIDAENDLAVEYLNPNEGTIIKFTKHMLDGINHNGGTHYIRFRLVLVDKLAKIFQDVSNPSDNMFFSGFHSNDVVEFRVN